MLKSTVTNISRKRVRQTRALFLFVPRLALALASVCILAGGSLALAAPNFDKPRDLLLKGDRIEAIKLLKLSYRESSKDQMEIAAAWREMAEMFLSDKGQNQYSLAESSWLTKPKDAVEILLPVLKAEDGNLTVARLGARSALRALDCARADVFTQQAELTYPIGADVKLLRLQVQDCLNGNQATAAPLKVSNEGDAGEFDAALRLLVVKDALRRKDWKAAKTALAAWETQASEDPEFWYWKWRFSAAPGVSRDRSAARKYLGLCRDMTPRRRKNFAMYPELCLHTESVESELKSSEKSGT